MKLLTALSLLFLSVSSAFSFHVEHPSDSVGFVKLNGQFYILHKVEKGEGLFSVARRYNSTVDEITKANPEVKSGLKLGQTIKVPATEPVKVEIKETPVTAPKANQASNTTTHEVQPGETLFSIARKYNLSVDELKKLNNLNDGSIKVGQTLKLNGNAVHAENYGGEEQKPTKPTNPSNSKPATPPTAPKPTENYEYNAATGEVKEKGMAAVALDESLDDKRSYALHATAPIGTIIMITNTDNNKSAFVRVVGRFESNDNQMIIKVSASSAERLGIEPNQKVNVRLNYAK